MANKFLYEELDSFSNFGGLNKEIPSYLKDNLNPKFELRPYQEEAFTRFFHCFDHEFPARNGHCIFCLTWRQAAARRLSRRG